MRLRFRFTSSSCTCMDRRIRDKTTTNENTPKLEYSSWWKTGNCHTECLWQCLAFPIEIQCMSSYFNAFPIEIQSMSSYFHAFPCLPISSEHSSSCCSASWARPHGCRSSAGGCRGRRWLHWSLCPCLQTAAWGTDRHCVTQRNDAGWNYPKTLILGQFFILNIMGKVRIEGGKADPRAVPRETSPRKPIAADPMSVAVNSWMKTYKVYGMELAHSDGAPITSTRLGFKACSVITYFDQGPVH